VRHDDEYDGADDDEEGVASSHQHRLMSLVQERLSRELAVAPKGSKIKIGSKGHLFTSMYLYFCASLLLCFFTSALLCFCASVLLYFCASLLVHFFTSFLLCFFKAPKKELPWSRLGTNGWSTDSIAPIGGFALPNGRGML
jgi:hypothetical protein